MPGTAAVFPRSPWKEAPLKDLILAILSLAAKEGRTRIPIVDFFWVFSELVEKFREIMPPVVFARTSNSAYSKRLDDAIQSLVGYSIDLPNPQLQYVEIPPDVADRHLTWLREKHGGGSIEGLKPIVEELLKNIKP